MAAYPDLQLCIGGKWKSADGQTVLNPADESVIGIVPRATRGGVKDSGYGREGGTEGLQCYTVAKNVSHLML
jgi:succinate-semialdehyde dehydrogenase/glutarate-semialdehyde dehydrogenase